MSDTADRSSTPLLFLLAALGLAALGVALLWFARGGGTGPQAKSSEILARGRAAAFYHKDQMQRAREALAPLVEGKRAISIDAWCDAASIEFADGDFGSALRFLDRADEVQQDSPRATFLRAQINRVSGDFEDALPDFVKTNAAVPGDLPTLLGLAEVLHGLDRIDEAEARYRDVIAVGAENGTAWYYAAIHRMSRLLVEEGREDEADRYFDIIEDLKRRGYEPPTGLQVSRGQLGMALSPEPAGSTIDTTPAIPAFESAFVILTELGNAEQLVAVDLDGDLDLDLVARGAHGTWAGFHDESGWRAAQVSDRHASVVCPFDMDNDGDLDLYLYEIGGSDWFAEQKDGEFTKSSAIPGRGYAVVHDAVAVDYDHEGDLDLVVVGELGPDRNGYAFLRNDGVASDEGGQFTDATDETTLGELPGTPNVLKIEDFDSDQDVDVLIGGWLASSLRAGRFEIVEPSPLPSGIAVGPHLVFADLDGDSRTDAVQLQDDAVHVWPQVDGAWPLKPTSLRPSIPGLMRNRADRVTIDLDLDGTLDLFWRHPEHVAEGIMSGGYETARVATLLPTLPPIKSLDAPFCLGDFNGDDRIDIARSVKEGVELFLPPDRAPHPGFRLSLQGVRDNRFAVGAIIELRSGAAYRRIFWDGKPQTIGMGPSGKIDILRITWPNGVLQEDLDLDLAARTSLEHKPETFGHYVQAAGLVGSCPFLYTWNGETYEFISDVLGITPLGLPMAPGMLVPPDSDEYVLVTGEQLKPKDGFYELQFTEELREVTYLDRAKLIVVDHPADTEIFPDERFTFPPFPGEHTHSVRAPLAAERVTGSDGADWTEAVRATDDVHAVPFETYEQQFMGLATPHTLTLEFDPGRVKEATKLRLLCTGWLFWTNASINMASARHPGVEFVPPILQVPDGNGGWRDTGPPVGFPAGKTKTMVIDVSELIDRDDPRVRIFSTLALYWDRIALATDDDDAPLVNQVLEPASAELWARGFSAPLQADIDNQAERFDWDVLADVPRWNQHPGRYTRLGDVSPLLGEVDDRFVIMGTGDALTLRFDARDLAPCAEGMRRDFLVFLDGWAKDRDPNTVEALEVEPLPFHGMSAYPYGEDEGFPATPEHAAWRAEWNTRPARRWIRPLAPVEEARWVLDG